MRPVGEFDFDLCGVGEGCGTQMGTVMDAQGPRSGGRPATCHPEAVDVRHDPNGSKLAFVLSSLLGNEGND